MNLLPGGFSTISASWKGLLIILSHIWQQEKIPWPGWYLRKFPLTTCFCIWCLSTIELYLIVVLLDMQGQSWGRDLDSWPSSTDIIWKRWALENWWMERWRPLFWSKFCNLAWSCCYSLLSLILLISSCNIFDFFFFVSSVYIFAAYLEFLFFWPYFKVYGFEIYVFMPHLCV